MKSFESFRTLADQAMRQIISSNLASTALGRFSFQGLLGILLLPILHSIALPANAQTPPPRVLYSDLESGPSYGGQNGGGAFVTVYGNGFGATRGTSVVTIGGGSASTYPVWSDSKITFQLGAAAHTGNIVVTVNGQASNGVPFTVRTGNIYFVAQNGSDQNAGSFASPWQTLQHAVDTIAPGDIIYAMNGVVQALPAYDGSLQLNNAGTAGNPMALAAYPGATVTIGATGSSQCTTETCYEGMLNLGISSHWVFSNLVFRGNDRALNIQGDATMQNGIVTDLRFVGNDFSCPWGGITADGCVTFGESLYVKFYGNNVHDVATLNAANAIDEGHGLYFSSDVSHVDAGWNQVYNVMSCRGIQVHSSPLYGGAADPTGYNVFDIHIHDNVVHNTRCDGIIMASLAPEKGPIEIYNNVIYSAGVGPLPQGGGGGFTCIYVSGGTDNGSDSNGAVNVYNNTMYNCGAYSRPDGAAVSAAVTLGSYSPNLKLVMQNNLINQTPSELYTWDYNAPAAHNLTGNNNLFYGSSTPPDPIFTKSVISAPALANVSGNDFHVQSSSPAVNTGAWISSLLHDKDGGPRPELGAYDIGAYEYGSGGSTSLPSVAVSLTPTTAALQAGQQQQFTATVTGSTNTSVTWLLTPAVGSITAAGVYTAPSAISTAQTVTVAATSVADTTKTAVAVVTLNPTVQVSVSVAPASAILSAGHTQQFDATVTGTTNSAVTWSLSPVVGTVSSTGLYTAPASISANQTVTVIATSNADQTKRGTATITLTAASSGGSTGTGPVISGISTTLSTGAAVTINWTTNVPADTQVDYGLTTAYGFSSPLASAAVGAHSVSLYSLNAGTVYHFRVKSRDASGNLAVSGDLTFTTSAASAYTLTASIDTSVSPPNVTLRWSVPSVSGNDWVALYPVGAANTDYIVDDVVNARLTGRSSFRVALPSGKYEFRFLVNNSYTSVATSNTIIAP